MKTCNKCGAAKPLNDFYSDATRKGGRYPNCKICHGEYTRARYRRTEEKAKRSERAKQLHASSQKFRDDAKRRGAKFYSSVDGRARALLNNARKSPATVSGKEFDITVDFIADLIKAGTCPMTGLLFDLTNDHQTLTGRVKNPYAPSLDRIDSRRGYTKDNVRVVIWQYNLMKGELTDAEVKLMCEQVLKQ